jgi:hypothetical protein
VRFPIPSAREVRWWFYVAAVCAFALSTTVVWGIVHKVSSTDSVLHVAVANADQVQRLSEQLDAQGQQLEALRVQAAKNARAARVAVRQNRSLLAYLKGNGIKIPKQFGSTSRTSGGAGSAPKAPASTGTTPKPRPSSPASPGHTATPTPTASPSGTGVDLGPLCVAVPLVCKFP